MHFNLNVLLIFRLVIWRMNVFDTSHNRAAVTGDNLSRKKRISLSYRA